MAPARRAETFLCGRRLGFDQAPPLVRERVARIVGGRIDDVRDASGGMSQGVAAVVGGPAGRVFVKAVGRHVNQFAFDALAWEATATRALPRHPCLPEVLAVETFPVVSGDVDGAPDHQEWSLLALTAFDGTPAAHPWRHDDMRRVLDAWGEVQPVVQAAKVPDDKPSDLADFLARWHLIAHDPTDAWHDLASHWVERCEVLAAAIAPGPDGVAAHADLRADNLVLGDGVGFVDWAHLSLAAPWADVLLLVLDMVGSGADVDQLWRTHRATRHLGPRLLADGAAALGGALHVAGRDEVPDLPHRHVWARAMATNLMAFAQAHADD